MTTATQSLGIIVVSCDRYELTKRCVESIRRHTATPYRIFLTDNGSREEALQGYLDRIEKDADVVLTRLDHNLGPSGGRNASLTRALPEHDALALIENDIAVLQNWDRAALAELGRGYDAVVPKLLDRDEETVNRGPTRPWKEEWLLHPEYIGRGKNRRDPEVNTRQEVALFPGAVILRRELLMKTGLFDEKIWVGEDYDLSLRAAAKGFRFIYAPDCEMIHDHGYNPEYERKRFNPRTALISHAVIWEKHRKVLLPPSMLKLYLHLAEAKEQFFLDGKGGLSGIYRKLRRRIMRKHFMAYGEVWRSYEDAERETGIMVARMRELVGDDLPDYAGPSAETS